MRWAEHTVRMGMGRAAYRVLAGKPAGKRPLRRSRHGGEDNINGSTRTRVGGLKPDLSGSE
jgi:hypothetical protein